MCVRTRRIMGHTYVDSRNAAFQMVTYLGFEIDSRRIA